MIRSTSEIWEAFSHDLRGFIARRVADADDMDDILQDVFIKIHTHIDTLQDDERLVPWLYRVTRNTITDYYRARRQTVELPEAYPASVEEKPDEDILQNLAVGVHGMIASLPEKYRQAVLLSEIDGVKQQDVAEQLGLSLSGAKSRVQRGRQLMRQELLDCCHFEFDHRSHPIEMVPRPDCCRQCCNNSRN
jgi:RNA polymerase sigma-70 factor, ECF subfamily